MTEGGVGCSHWGTEMSPGTSHPGVRLSVTWAYPRSACGGRGLPARPRQQARGTTLLRRPNVPGAAVGSTGLAAARPSPAGTRPHAPHPPVPPGTAVGPRPAAAPLPAPRHGRPHRARTPPHQLPSSQTAARPCRAGQGPRRAAAGSGCVPRAGTRAATNTAPARRPPPSAQPSPARREPKAPVDGGGQSLPVSSWDAPTSLGRYLCEQRRKRDRSGQGPPGAAAPLRSATTAPPAPASAVPFRAQCSGYTSAPL